MNKEDHCGIVEDLLTSYIDKKTGKRTNDFIEEHIASCEQCRSLLLFKREKMESRKGIIDSLKNIKRLKRSRAAAAFTCVILSVVLSFLVYGSEYKYSNNKEELSAAITDYTSHGRYSADAYVLETKEADGVLIVFFKDRSNPAVYGFARLLKGVNQKYRLIRANFSPSDYSAVVKSYEFETGKGTYYAIGGHNIDSSIAAFGLRFITGFESNDKEQRITYDIKNSQFLEVYKKSALLDLLSGNEDARAEYFFDPFHTALLNKEGQEITEDYKRADIADKNWSSGTGTAELFLLNFFIGFILILGFILARYFLTKD